MWPQRADAMPVDVATAEPEPGPRRRSSITDSEVLNGLVILSRSRRLRPQTSAGPVRQGADRSNKAERKSLVGVGARSG